MFSPRSWTFARRHVVKYLSKPPPPPPATHINNSDRPGPFPLAGDMWLPANVIVCTCELLIRDKIVLAAKKTTRGKGCLRRKSSSCCKTGSGTPSLLLCLPLCLAAPVPARVLSPLGDLHPPHAPCCLGRRHLPAPQMGFCRGSLPAGEAQGGSGGLGAGGGRVVPGSVATDARCPQSVPG